MLIKNSVQPFVTSRRKMLKLSMAAMCTLCPLSRAMADVLSELSPEAMVTVEEFAVNGHRNGIVRSPKIIKTLGEWRALLPADTYLVTRQGEPDHPYTGALWNSHAKGTFYCACCDLAVFSSEHKFESGTGWPSFWQPISALNIQRGNGTFSCARCDAHLGLVVGDGPAPSGIRYSAFSVALKFESAKE